MVLESVLHLVDSKYQILHSGSQKLPDSRFFPGFWIPNAVILKSKDEYVCQTFLDSRSKHFLLAELIDRSSRFSSEKLCVPLELHMVCYLSGFLFSSSSYQCSRHQHNPEMFGTLKHNCKSGFEYLRFFINLERGCSVAQ